MINLIRQATWTANLFRIKQNIKFYSSFFNAVEKVRQPNIQLSMLPRYLKFIYN
jgi:hypothetical protein